MIALLLLLAGCYVASFSGNSFGFGLSFRPLLAGFGCRSDPLCFLYLFSCFCVVVLDFVFFFYCAHRSFCLVCWRWGVVVGICVGGFSTGFWWLFVMFLFLCLMSSRFVVGWFFVVFWLFSVVLCFLVLSFLFFGCLYLGWFFCWFGIALFDVSCFFFVSFVVVCCVML